MLTFCVLIFFVDLDDNPPIESSFNNTLLDMSLYFECGSGEIISFMGVCDGMVDCISGKDEEHCQTSSTLKIIISCTLDKFIFEILPWNILLMLSYSDYQLRADIGCIGTHFSIQPSHS